MISLDARKAWTLAVIGRVAARGRRAGWLPGEPPPHVPSDAEIEALRAAAGEDPVLSRLDLTASEIDALWVLACVELEPLLERASRALTAPNGIEITAQTLERLVDLGPRGLARLARLGLVEANLDRRVPVHRRAVRIADRMLEIARGIVTLDHECERYATLLPAKESTEKPLARDTLFVSIGVPGSGRAMAARARAGGMAVIDVRTYPSQHDELSRQLRIVARECRLHGAAVLLRDIDSIPADILLRELDAFDGIAIVATARELPSWPTRRNVASCKLHLPDEAERQTMWRESMPRATSDVVDACAARYCISAAMIASVGRSVNEAPELHAVHAALRARLERGAMACATRVEVTQTWDDLVLPVDQFDLLTELVARVRHRREVLDRWGFAAKVGRGTGLSALLSGPPGTGKTMIAGLIARELGLDLYQVDLSRVVSKYIGETEKQLGALFDAAETGHAVLLFDEADSLFGKRTEVKSSNDRYANLEVNYLLQRMEAFSGISIMTSNHEASIDPAFQRRLAFHIRVPMPDEDHRAMLWQTMLPERAPVGAGLDFATLGRNFELSGGYIRNAALRAAFAAAEDGMPITQSHLHTAARLEYESIGRVTGSQLD